MVPAAQVSEYESEVVRGEVVERPIPDITHAMLGALVTGSITPAIRTHGIFVGVELRVKTSVGNQRVIDIAVYRTKPSERHPSQPPLAAIEILSQADLFDVVYEKCDEYQAWGVANIWVVDPKRRRLWVYDRGELHAQDELALPEYGVHIVGDELFSLAI